MTWFTLSVEGWMREWMVAGPRDHKAEGCPVQGRREKVRRVCGLGGKPTAHHNLHRHPRDHMLSSRALASTIAGGVGFGMGFAAAHLTQSSRSGSSSLCGGFRLVSGDKTAGVLLYEPDGSVVCQTCSGNGCVAGYSGRWMLHNASTSFAATYPPHDGDLVEHCITAASDAKLVGTSQVLRYTLGPDGRDLTLSTMALRDGRSQPTSTMKWQRMMVSSAAEQHKL